MKNAGKMPAVRVIRKEQEKGYVEKKQLVFVGDFFDGGLWGRIYEKDGFEGTGGGIVEAADARDDGVFEFGSSGGSGAGDAGRGVGGGVCEERL